MKVFISVILVLISAPSFSQDNSSRIEHFNTNDQNVVNDGYDPVSYFDGDPLEGVMEHSYNYKGVTYWFASATNRAKFIKSPKSYEPQYGGWCAYALGHKPEKVKVDPNTYKIVEGKLYLFYNFYLTNTLKSWNKDETNLKLNADKNWVTIIE